MPFKETCRVEERIGLFRDYDTQMFTVTELCEHYGISRQTFYVWKQRREAGEAQWYEEGSRAAHGWPHAVDADRVAAIVAMRRRFGRFGPKKIRARLMVEQPGTVWPAASTIGDILKRAGLVEPRKRRRRGLDQGEIVAGADVANGEWAIDFKGWFRTRDGMRCDPLTVSDTASRYLLELRIMNQTYVAVRSALERVFAEYGLPEAMRSDVGAPFGANGAGGLSRLTVWLLKLDIEPRFIPPASPQDNGRHERMHRTLKDHTARPPAKSLPDQQVRFDAFRRHYNEERPHEALGQTPPAELWRASERPLPARVETPWYDPDHQVRKVAHHGDIKWRGSKVFISTALAGEPVGLAELETGGHLVRFANHALGVIDRDGRFHRFAAPRTRLRYAAETTGTKGE
jgi:transposase InsO family protein